MMNRSTQKELIKLLLQLNEMWTQLDLSNTEQQNMVLDILNTVSSKCQKDFSKANAERYADTMESLAQVIKMTNWQHTGKKLPIALVCVGPFRKLYVTKSIILTGGVGL